jgi:YegS/Rv2252/BmrU family lipid kinase
MANIKNNIVLIVNQDAGKVPARMAELRKLAKHYKLKLTMVSGQDIDYEIREALKNKRLKRIIVGGGDGTISKAASLILRKNNKIELAVLPLGTANYYAKSLGVKRSLGKAFSVAINGKTENRHLCRANKREFLIGLNIGTTSRMFSEVTDEEKQRFGKLAYFKGVFKVLLNATPPDLEVKANGIKKRYTSTEMVILNQHIQDSFKLTPEVSGGDPYFEIITYGLGRNKLSPLFAVIVFALSFGRNQKYLKRIKTTKATIKSNKKHSVAIDGESLGSLPLRIELIKKPVIFVTS